MDKLNFRIRIMTEALGFKYEDIPDSDGGQPIPGYISGDTHFTQDQVEAMTTQEFVDLFRETYKSDHMSDLHVDIICGEDESPEVLAIYNEVASSLGLSGSTTDTQMANAAAEVTGPVDENLANRQADEAELSAPYKSSLAQGLVIKEGEVDSLTDGKTNQDDIDLVVAVAQALSVLDRIASKAPEGDFRVNEMVIQPITRARRFLTEARTMGLTANGQLKRGVKSKVVKLG